MSASVFVPATAILILELAICCCFQLLLASGKYCETQLPFLCAATFLESRDLNALKTSLP
jgi:hypothetical protein